MCRITVEILYILAHRLMDRRCMIVADKVSFNWRGYAFFSPILLQEPSAGGGSLPACAWGPLQGSGSVPVVVLYRPAGVPMPRAQLSWQKACAAAERQKPLGKGGGDIRTLTVITEFVRLKQNGYGIRGR